MPAVPASPSFSLEVDDVVSSSTNSRPFIPSQQPEPAHNTAHAIATNTPQHATPTHIRNTSHPPSPSLSSSPFPVSPSLSSSSFVGTVESPSLRVSIATQGNSALNSHTNKGKQKQISDLPIATFESESHSHSFLPPQPHSHSIPTHTTTQQTHTTTTTHKLESTPHASPISTSPSLIRVSADPNLSPSSPTPVAASAAGNFKSLPSPTSGGGLAATHTPAPPGTYVYQQVPVVSSPLVPPYFVPPLASPFAASASYPYMTASATASVSNPPPAASEFNNNANNQQHNQQTQTFTNSNTHATGYYVDANHSTSLPYATMMHPSAQQSYGFGGPSSHPSAAAPNAAPNAMPNSNLPLPSVPPSHAYISSAPVSDPMLPMNHPMRSYPKPNGFPANHPTGASTSAIQPNAQQIQHTNHTPMMENGVPYSSFPAMQSMQGPSYMSHPHGYVNGMPMSVPAAGYPNAMRMNPYQMHQQQKYNDFAMQQYQYQQQMHLQQLELDRLKHQQQQSQYLVHQLGGANGPATATTFTTTIQTTASPQRPNVTHQDLSQPRKKARRSPPMSPNAAGSSATVHTTSVASSFAPTSASSSTALMSLLSASSSIPTTAISSSKFEHGRKSAQNSRKRTQHSDHDTDNEEEAEHSGNDESYVKREVVEHRGRPKAARAAAAAAAAASQPPSNIASLIASSLEPEVDPVTGISLYICRFSACGDTFKTRFSLKRHLKKHSGEKPFTCHYDGCRKQFAEKSTLKRHVRIHTGEKPYRCSVIGCGKYFADRTNVRRHEMIHSGMRPYWCPHPNCTRGYFWRLHLKKHMQTVHKEELQMGDSDQEEDAMVPEIDEMNELDRNNLEGGVVGEEEEEDEEEEDDAAAEEEEASEEEATTQTKSRRSPSTRKK